MCLKYFCQNILETYAKTLFDNLAEGWHKAMGSQGKILLWLNKFMWIKRDTEKWGCEYIN